MPDPHQPEGEPSTEPTGADRKATEDPESGSTDPSGERDPAAGPDPIDGEDAGDGTAGGTEGDEDGREDQSEGRARRLSREAREAAEAERAAREQQAAYEEALDLARADAERMLAGPGLVAPDPTIPPTELEEGWNGDVRRTLDAIRQDLRGHRVGLAISGGGALGSFEAGALRFIYDHLEVEPVAICGNSAGALNAAKLAEGAHEDRRPIDEVERIWRSLRINSDMWEPEPWLVRLQASASWAAELKEQVTDAEGATSAVKVAVRVVGSLVRRPPETDGTIDAVKEAIRAKSLLSLSPVAELVERELDPERVKASGISLRMGTVSLEAGELRYVTEDGALHDRHDHPIDQPNVPLTSGVLASASIPMAFPPVEMNGEHYVDGGAREILPLELLAHRMGAERVIAISASSASIKRAPSFADRNLIDILRRVSAEIGPNETLRKELDPPGGWDPNVRLIVPQFDVHDSMTIDPALIAISLDHGYMRAADVLLSLGEEASELTERITRLRIELRNLAGPVPSFFDTALGRDRRERLEGRSADGKGANGAGAIEVDVVPDVDDEDEAERIGEGVVKVARARTVTTVAKLVKAIGRDNGDREGADREPEDDGADAADDGAVHVDVAVTGPVDADGATADVAVHETGGSVHVVVTPHGTNDEDRRERSEQPVPDLDAPQSTDGAAEARRRADVARITAELRGLTQRRFDLGLPLPRTLVAWLREPVAEDDQAELHPVGGSVLGGA